MEKMQKQATVSVAVATVWTAPDSPREMDTNALQNPVRIKDWVAQMNNEDRLGLYSGNRVQTQVLYGTDVYVLEEKDDWVKIAIPEQPSPKEPLGYPGWVPACQLSQQSLKEADTAAAVVTVTANTTHLYSMEKQSGIELSFLTKLPVLEEGDRWITVSTPHGPQLIARDDVSFGTTDSTTNATAGKAMAETAKRFLGLHYLWGGVSAFGFDCSGFAYALHRAQGITIPRDSSVQAKQGCEIERTDLMPGDLLFFAHDEGKGSVHHVGMYIGDNQMIHSPDSASTIEIVSLQGYKLEKEHCVSRRYW